MAIETADRVEIEDLVARYNKAIDTGDAQGWAATFTKDGEFHGIVGDFYGADELVAFVSAYASEEQYAEFASAQHWVTNMVIEGGGDHAEMFAHVMMVAPQAEGGRIILVGHYEDTLQKVDGRWRFAKRVVRV
ncbi:MAG: DUF4440 domain-containing protein [Acidimicrobiia bacterium]|nr:DUF4440 domain-containing protein [Acidimicrobiia bacterium]